VRRSGLNELLIGAGSEYVLLLSLRKETNSPITGTYVVDVATVKPSPDVRLCSVNGHIDTTLYFQGGLPRQIGIDVTSTNGHIRLAFPEQQHAQRLNIRVRSVNGTYWSQYPSNIYLPLMHAAGRIHLLLPQTYQGLLISSTNSGRTILSDALLDNSKLVQNDGHRAVYRISPQATDEKADEGHKLSLKDECSISDVNADILIVYYGENFDWELGLDQQINQQSCLCLIA
jgi:hypothetical protein